MHQDDIELTVGFPWRYHSYPIFIDGFEQVSISYWSAGDIPDPVKLIKRPKKVKGYRMDPIDNSSYRCSVCRAYRNTTIHYNKVDEEDFYLVDGKVMCRWCRRDYRRDHPDMEQLVEEAEHQHDLRTNR